MTVDDFRALLVTELNLSKDDAGAEAICSIALQHGKVRLLHAHASHLLGERSGALREQQATRSSQCRHTTVF